ncbi:hypothetical protein XAC2852_160177 [Xanthomonas citri pv. citri]|uniref:Uncharacterized protein n=1 Tax=Xanthomonas citri pv. citri TaxID=611301 RepID=A0A0U5FCW3_XANCI|nr:hypothetical protein XAC2852_160177 [Xanthomonas citri pv. citri]CEE82861.1 hypothetical protein XACLE20_310036 [Xanthomonas citri pv. citri]CEF43963.1 hypothetical protein XAC217_170038 [Xanthomonas citri pv. citri]CEG14853.1 hypothetical protein XAC3562_130037 [Xanthomonas citri pv. citri]CEH43445.1 hypothetical protein XACG102_2200005 [Xanthomonas citri pv. citri]
MAVQFLWRLIVGFVTQDKRVVRWSFA